VPVLFVCTGNLCRSPLAEGLLRAWVDDERADLTVASAGVEARDGAPMDPQSAAALRELGGDPTAFRSHRLTAADSTRAGLVLTMNRWHRRQVLERDPRALRKAFTLGEASRLLPLADRTGLALVPVPERPAELAARLHAARARRADSGADDVSDPIGRPAAEHRAMAAHVAALLRPLADVLLAVPSAPPIPRRPAAGAS
jgi:protein-tyrosine phosphatase